MSKEKPEHWIADTDGSLEPATPDEIKRCFPDLADKFDELASAHGELVVAPTKAGTFVLRVPKAIEYERFLGAILGENKEAKVKAARTLIGAACVFPDRDSFVAGVSRYPGIPTACTKPINKLMGGELVERGKD